MVCAEVLHDHLLAFCCCPSSKLSTTSGTGASTTSSASSSSTICSANCSSMPTSVSICDMGTLTLFLVKPVERVVSSGQEPQEAGEQWLQWLQWAGASLLYIGARQRLLTPLFRTLVSEVNDVNVKKAWSPVLPQMFSSTVPKQCAVFSTIRTCQYVNALRRKMETRTQLSHTKKF